MTTENIKDAVNICFASDENYIPHLSAAIASIIVNANKERALNFYIINNGSISARSIANVEELAKKRKHTKIQFLNIDASAFKELAFSFPIHITEAAYYRYIIPNLLNDIDKVIYLDCDLIVVSDIAELFDINIDDKCIAAVEDVRSIPQQERLNLKVGERHYFNSGVIVINNVRMRELNIMEKLFDCTLKYGDSFKFADQDALNIVLEDETKYLDIAWNMQYYRKNAFFCYDEKIFSDAIRSPKIIHFIASNKPWLLNTNRLYAEEYWKYLSYTKYYWQIRHVHIKDNISKFIYSNKVRKRKKSTTKRVQMLGLQIYKRVQTKSESKQYILGIKLRRKRLKK